MINMTMMPNVNQLMLYIKLISILIRIILIKKLAKNTIIRVEILEIISKGKITIIQIIFQTILIVTLVIIIFMDKVLTPINTIPNQIRINLCTKAIILIIGQDNLIVIKVVIIKEISMIIMTITKMKIIIDIRVFLTLH